MKSKGERETLIKVILLKAQKGGGRKKKRGRPESSRGGLDVYAFTEKKFSLQNERPLPRSTILLYQRRKEGERKGKAGENLKENKGCGENAGGERRRKSPESYASPG